ncbi:c-type cytochrome [Trinickia caryophylli]|uniref:Amino acid ABC transporter substrate-binding protein, PAAT family n=1 Tax=Trinickia caryophylli TaxID=28094 RepID=A0A1X7CH75_TRICW|nr:c-type cytochrome [Trinickia caryophylli]PMS11575.1 cytochrome C [Trinickia caryophylli]TRX19872.1 transporter substrate-binding domain-containing protein [Trinickia caryophylli]WQE12794.1 c-type cytochrome [Trinickia caryophylli]SME96466.1 amino acid ABC transporter substrate-binding protein, PAAT family [Trinickia caryophylli]GLU30510.1 hypothetical protein Busp01_03520 [Trinickia caryophylli]
MNTNLTRLAATSIVALAATLADAPANAAVRVCMFDGSPSSVVDRAVAREAFKAARIDASFVADAIAGGDDDGVSLKELRRALTRRCDVIAGFPRSSVADATSPDLVFSRGYLRAGYVSVQEASAGNAPGAAGAREGVVAATYGSPAQLIAVQARGVKLDLENTPALTVAAVAEGRAQRAIVWYPAVVAYRQAHPQLRFDVAATQSPYADWHLVFAIAARHAALGARLDRALSAMRADGRLAALTREWDMPVGLQAAASHAGRAQAVPGDGLPRAGIMPAVLGAGGRGAFVRVSAQPPSEAPSFDAVQVSHGKKLYANACAKCHGAKLEGVTAPALTGPAFAPASNSHLTIGGIFGYMSTNMPADRPGKLKPQDYADIMAFLLSSNGYRPKAEKLTADVAKASATPLNAGPQQ